MNWNQRRENKNSKLNRIKRRGKQVAAGEIVDALEQILAPGNRVILEGEIIKSKRIF